MSELAEKLAKFKTQAASQLADCGVSNIDDALLDKLVNNLRLVINNKDAVLVSGTDPLELETVRKNFVVKKLNFDDKDKAMTVINNVAQKMGGSGIKMKNRAAFYYMVQKAL